MMTDLAVLCARRDSVYKSIPGLDVYDADRDAFTFGGGVPVIAHPPCRGWGRYRHRSQHSARELELARFCLYHVRQAGGVLEHPACSSLWEEQCLPRPGQAPSREGFTLAIDQSFFGHPARKRTWLYFHGVDCLPRMPFRLGYGTPVELLGRAAREHTPKDLALWLVQCLMPLVSPANRLE